MGTRPTVLKEKEYITAAVKKEGTLRLPARRPLCRLRNMIRRFGNPSPRLEGSSKAPKFA